MGFVSVEHLPCMGDTLSFSWHGKITKTLWFQKYFKTKSVTRGEERHFMLLIKSIIQGTITIINISMQNRSPIYTQSRNEQSYSNK